MSNGASDAVSSTVSDAVDSGFEKVATAMAEAAETVLREVTTAWTRVPTGGVVNQGVIESLLTNLRPVAAAVAVLSLIFAAAKTTLSRDGRDMKTAGAGLLRVLLVGSAGLLVLQVAMAASDDVSRAILDQSAAGGEFNAMIPLTGGAVAPGLMFLLGILAIITGIIQIGLLLVRGAVIVVLAAGWQIAAAASITEGGSVMWKKVSGWLLAWLLYKPAAAVVYAAAFELMMPSGGEPDALSVIQGLLLLVLAILALPAMLKLVNPAVGAMGGGPSTAGLVAGAATVATGAAALAATGGASAAAGGGASAAAGGGASAAAGGGASAAAGSGAGAAAGGGQMASGAAPSGGGGAPGGGTAAGGGGGASGADPSGGGSGAGAGGAPPGGGADSGSGDLPDWGPPADDDQGGSGADPGAGGSWVTPGSDNGGPDTSPGAGPNPNGGASGADPSGGGSSAGSGGGAARGGSPTPASGSGPSGSDPSSGGGAGGAARVATAVNGAGQAVASGANDVTGDDDDSD